jgi:hypothetical protein
METGFVSPNPGGLVANITSKTQNFYEKFIIQNKIENNL